MSERVSPFTALSGAERQIKWLEYQSIRLPYIEGSVEGTSRTQAPLKSASQQTDSQYQPEPLKAIISTEKKPSDIPTRADMRIRHRQYDAVVERIRQAEMRTHGYQSLP